MLDDPKRISGIDPRDMLGTIRRMPEHLCEGMRRGEAAAVEGPAPSDIVVCGLGGSAIGGDVLRAWLATQGDSRCEVVRDYSVPGWVGPETLAIVASYSGDTEETLSLLQDVLDRKATVVGVTSGGSLAKRARTESFRCVEVPSGMVPRASFGYVFGAMMGLVGRATATDLDSQIDDAMRALERVTSECDATVETAHNPAKRLAHELHGLVPVVIGHGLSMPVAKRWANQLNENAKLIAFSSQLPEMDHNEIVFWSSDPRSRGFAGVFLDHDFSDDRMARRLKATSDTMSQNSRVVCVRASGTSPLSQMLTLVLIGDYVSFYSAVLAGRDPSTTEPIESLKKAIAKK